MLFLRGPDGIPSAIRHCDNIPYARMSWGHLRATTEASVFTVALIAWLLICLLVFALALA